MSFFIYVGTLGYTQPAQIISEKGKNIKNIIDSYNSDPVILQIAAVLTCCCSEDPGIDVREYVGITANANSTLTLYNEGGNNPNLEYSVDYGAS